MKKTTAAAAASVLALALTMTACAQDDATRQPGPTLTVFAAASLRSTFTEIGKDFETDHPGTKVAFSFDGSSTLFTQIREGAPADVFASADEQNMARAVDGKLVAGTPQIFATNVLTLAVVPGNPLTIRGLDKSLDGKKLVVCAEGVPCGNATAKLSKGLGVTLTPVSTEQSVTDVLGKVTSGEADAGVVYVTDARAAGNEVTAVSIAGAEQAVNRYPIAVTAGSEQVDLAQQFVDAVTSQKGQRVLSAAGFGTP